MEKQHVPNMFHINYILYIQICFIYIISYIFKCVSGIFLMIFLILDFQPVWKTEQVTKGWGVSIHPSLPANILKLWVTKSLVWEDIAASKFFSTALRESQCLWCWRRGLGADESLQVRPTLLAYYLNIIFKWGKHNLKTKGVNVIDVWIIYQPWGTLIACPNEKKW